ncbi:hypothetical protein [Enterococcus sp. AZ192]|uniref:hypothetical protein n=1 Tax=unclassified Enterococcus TaxID=2608891 RepID=UPI003D2B5702
MDKYYTILADSGKLLFRNKLHTIVNTLSITGYFFSLTLVIRCWLTLNYFEALERENLLNQNDLIDSFTQSAAARNLILLLTSLKSGLFLISLGLFLAGLFYLFIHFQHILLIDKEELITKKLLGSSDLRLTSELFSDFLLFAIPSACIGLLSAQLLYMKFFLTATSWIKELLYTPSRFFLLVDLPLIGVFLLVLIFQFFRLNSHLARL